MGYETADWIAEDNIDITGLADQSTALRNVMWGSVNEYKAQS